jgi:starch synthase
MKIVFAASEMEPFAKTGGLADVIGSLSGEIKALGHEVIAFLPRYKNIDTHKKGLQTVLENLEVQVGSEKIKGTVFSFVAKNGVTVYFIDQPDFFNRDTYYGNASGDFPDNDRRFVFFQRAVLESLKRIPFKPDVIHCNDWQTGLIPVYLKTVYANDAFFSKTKSVFTIHNLAYQGNFPPDSLPMTGLGWEHFTMQRLEFYGKFSFLKGGIIDADSVTTVSERYAQEIQSKEFGCGLEGVLSRRREQLHGVLNGIDPKDWNPATDTEIYEKFDAKKIEKKLANKTALQKENNLSADPKAPLFGVVSRLVEQKGLDILIPAMEALSGSGCQFIVLGTGEEKYHHALRDLAKRNKGKFSVHITFDAKFAKKMYAGCDMVLLPSYYEPCGLAQMIGLRFGTIPVVRYTGGLADTIQEFDPKTGKGNGFVFKEYKADALRVAIERSVEVYKNTKQWQALMENAMACDFSWGASARKYEHIYEITKKRTLSV